MSLGLDIGVFSAKGVLINLEGEIITTRIPTAGRPVEAAQECLDRLLNDQDDHPLKIGVMGQNARLVSESLGLTPLLEIEALQAGLESENVVADYVLSLGHENMHYLELDEKGQISYFNRNGQCAAGSGSFWYQQATRMGYNDRELADIAVEADSHVPISGRCAVFAKSDMTHAINEGATQGAVSAGMGRALVDNIVTSVAQNRLKGPGRLAVVGGVANNKAIIKFLAEYATSSGIELFVPENHEYINALGAAVRGALADPGKVLNRKLVTPAYRPANPLPPLEPDRVTYLRKEALTIGFDLGRVYLGVDCGSVSTKCVLLDRQGKTIGGIYLPTTGRPALQVLELMKQVEIKYKAVIGDAPITACTTGSGRFLSQKILNAEYAVDEITCQAEGIKHLFRDENNLSIIEIGGEDSKFIQLRDGILFDYNMNPVCAAGTGTFLENLAELLGINIKEEFSSMAFSADYAVDLGDICTLISQSILASASARGLPLNEQLASLAYSSAQNYLSKTVDKRPLEGKVVFAGATAKNHALAAALAAISDKKVHVPPEPELTGALGSALMARQLQLRGEKSDYSFNNFYYFSSFTSSKKACRAECKHEHNCILNIINFKDGNKFIYGDRCGRYSSVDSDKAPVTLPDYGSVRMKLLDRFSKEQPGEAITVGIAKSGLYFDYYPFWATFFSELGCSVVLSGETTAETLHKGKIMLDSEMCYPMKVIVGHYRELEENNPDYIFIPEVVNTENLPWAPGWPRSFTCPLLQTLSGTIQNSLDLDENKVLYAQLNYREGAAGIREQLEPVAKRILGAGYSKDRLESAVSSAYRAQDDFRSGVTNAAAEMFEDLKNYRDHAVAVFLSRGYTLYDQFISKKSMYYARKSNILAIPHEFFTTYLQAWFNGEISSPYLDPFRSEFKAYLQDQIQNIDNIYPAQLQKILSAVLFINFLNRKADQTGLPRLNTIFLDPFKCGPNAMLRHFLNDLTGYLRLTLDEHTAASGMITRLEAFRNTCLSTDNFQARRVHSSATISFNQSGWKKMLIPDPTLHSKVFAAMFRSRGIDAEILPRGKNGDLSLAQGYVNGEECLPFIQNLQDFLQYMQENGGGENGEVFFQGGACGPCRYGLYAPAQALALNRAGFGECRVCSIRFGDVGKRCGYAFIVGLYNGLLAMDLLYKMLHRVRPYEKEPGSADELFDRYSKKLAYLLENSRFSFPRLVMNTYRTPLENLLGEAADDFSRLPVEKTLKPIILLGGEFYVRLDDRCNQDVIKKIEEAGGEVSLAPVTELFTYTLYIDYHETLQAYRLKGKLSDYLKQALYSLLIKIAYRDEVALENATGPLLADLHEPAPWEIMNRALKYVSRHYGGEPPMTIGRAAAFAGRERVSGALFVAPFTCMPSSVVEALQGPLQDELGIPVVTLYYDGKDNANRDEMVEGLVYQARQKLNSGRTDQG